MSNISRRSIVSSAIALPAMAVPALPAVADEVAASSDTELQQLGVGLLRVKRERDAIAAIARDAVSVLSDPEERELEARCTVANDRLCALMEPILRTPRVRWTASACRPSLPRWQLGLVARGCGRGGAARR